jgi:hypothetical protein
MNTLTSVTTCITIGNEWQGAQDIKLMFGYCYVNRQDDRLFQNGSRYEVWNEIQLLSREVNTTFYNQHGLFARRM